MHVSRAAGEYEGATLVSLRILTLIFTMVIQKRNLNKLQEITPVAVSYNKEKGILLQITAMLPCKSLLGYQSHSIKENLHRLSFR